MKRRTVLFGYKFENGSIAIDEPNADIVKEIFSQYLDKKSLLEISELMNKLHIEYMPGIVDWNKARIKRILEDKRYLGDSKYPPIIDLESYERVNAYKHSRNNQKNTDRGKDIYNLEATVVCPICGSEMKRRIEKRAKIHERWKCQNAECRKTVAIHDDDFFSGIRGILIKMSDTPSLLTAPDDFSTESVRIIKLENEINRMFEYQPTDKRKLKDRVFELAALQYDELNDLKYETERLRALFAGHISTADFPIELFNRTVDTISFDTENKIIMKMLNGQIIREEEGYAAS